MRMKHPDHGFHVAYSPAEEAWLKARGWVEDDGAELRAKLAALEPVAAPAEVEAPKRKPGRPRKEA